MLRKVIVIIQIILAIWYALRAKKFYEIGEAYTAQTYTLFAFLWFLVSVIDLLSIL